MRPSSSDFPNDVKCPLYRKAMSKVCPTCAWVVAVRGKNPQSDEVIPDRWGCAIAWQPMLTIENTQMQRQTGAATESFRNEMAMAHKEARNLSMQIANVAMRVPRPERPDEAVPLAVNGGALPAIEG